MNNIIARNILIHKEIEKISQKCVENSIKLVLLKGVALIELFPEYSFERYMEDVDVLIEEKSLKKFRDILFSLGYNEYKEDPNVMYNKQIDLKIDISTRLWYLSKKENQKVINSALKVRDFYILQPNEFLKHIVLHAYIEHNYIENKWIKDIELIKNKYSLQLDLEKILPKFVVFLLKRKIYYKGHILQFYFLPWKQKFIFLLQKFLPSKEFMRRRYNIKYNFLLPIFYLYRWASFVINSFLFFNNLINSHE